MSNEKLIANNKRAYHEYHIDKKVEAGLVLKGSEVKSCMDGKVQLVDSFATIEKGECFLFKVHIAEFPQGGPFFNHEPTRKRKLLLHRREIAALKDFVEQKGYTVVPLRMYFKKGLAKVELGIARGKSKGDKRAATKEREAVRQVDRAIRRHRYDDDE